MISSRFAQIAVAVIALAPAAAAAQYGAGREVTFTRPEPSVADSGPSA
jgi:hypothetical protein